MEIEFINLETGWAMFGCGFHVPITDLFDEYGDDCDGDDAVTCVVGPLPGDGGWMAIDLLDHDEVGIH